VTKDIPLDAFVRRISTAAERLFVKNNFVLSPIFIGQRADGEPVTVVIDTAMTKDETGARMRAIAAELDFVRCAYVDEAWTAVINMDTPERGAAELAIANRIGVKHHPQRRECVIISAEDHNGSLMGTRYILRPEHGNPALSPLRIDHFDRSEGRFVGFLPPKGRKQ
jgi:hypothetical protein